MDSQWLEILLSGRPMRQLGTISLRQHPGIKFFLDNQQVYFKEIAEVRSWQVMILGEEEAPLPNSDEISYHLVVYGDAALVEWGIRRGSNEKDACVYFSSPRL